MTELYKSSDQGYFRLTYFDSRIADADKRSYQTYLDQLLHLVRPGGIIVVDNVLWYGRVADPQVMHISSLVHFQSLHRHGLILIREHSLCCMRHWNWTGQHTLRVKPCAIIAVGQKAS